jgi:hypothetical protein
VGDKDQLLIRLTPLQLPARSEFGAWGSPTDLKLPSSRSEQVSHVKCKIASTDVKSHTRSTRSAVEGEEPKTVAGGGPHESPPACRAQQQAFGMRC